MTKSIVPEKEKIQSLIWAFLVAIWFFRYQQGLLLHQLYAAPFISVKADNVFWIYHASQIPHYVIQHYYLALLLDSSWLLIGFLGLWKKKPLFLSILMTSLVLNYLIIYNSIATHHEHQLVALLFCCTLLGIKKNDTFVLVFAAIRYYVLFILFSAGLWKVFRGSLFEMNQMSEILKHQHIEYLLSYPNSHFSTFITYLINNSECAAVFWYGGWIVELTFVIGFMNRKFDKLLGILFLVFFLMDYLLMHLCFIEFCIFALVFYPWKGIWSHYETELK